MSFNAQTLNHQETIHWFFFFNGRGGFGWDKSNISQHQWEINCLSPASHIKGDHYKDWNTLTKLVMESLIPNLKRYCKGN